MTVANAAPKTPIPNPLIPNIGTISNINMGSRMILTIAEPDMMIICFFDSPILRSAVTIEKSANRIGNVAILI